MDIGVSEGEEELKYLDKAIRYDLKVLNLSD